MNFYVPLFPAFSAVLAYLAHVSHVMGVEVVEDLKLVQLIFRHGDRAPLHTYKGDEWGEKIWKNGYGRLTAKGMKQQFELGKFFRQRYSKFLDPSQAANQVYIRSSDQDRTLQSAAAFSAGMFPPSSDTAWDEGLGQTWRPVSIHSVPYEAEILLSKQGPCPKYLFLKNELVDLNESRTLYHEQRAMFDILANNSGEPPISGRKAAFDLLGRVQDTVFCQRAHGYDMPKWMDITTYNKMEWVYGLGFHLWNGANGDKARARLAGGNLMALLLERMTGKRDKFIAGETNQTKAYVYSGHDTTVSGILATLGLYNYTKTEAFMGVPNYTATIIFELFYNDTVRILLKNEVDNIPLAEPRVLRVGSCDLFCPLSQLKELTKDYVVTDWNAECQGPSIVESLDVSDITVAMIAVILVIILTTVALGCYKRRADKKDPKANGVHHENGTVVTYTRLNEDDGL